jgi:hypothetical protein
MPSSAKVVLLIRSVRPVPARLGRPSNPKTLCPILEPTVTCIGPNAADEKALLKKPKF